MAVSSNLHHCGDDFNTSSISLSLRSSPQSQIIHGSRSNAASTRSFVALKPVALVDSRQQQTQQQPQQQQQSQQQQQQSQLDVNQSCINFMDPTQYATVNLQSVVTGGFTTSAAPILSTVPTHEVKKLIIQMYYVLKLMYMKFAIFSYDCILNIYNFKIDSTCLIYIYNDLICT